MNPFSPDDPSVDSLTNQANAWVVRITSGHATAADAQALRAWCALSPAHAQAYRQATRLWRQLGDLAPLQRAQPSRLARRRLLSAGAAAVVLLGAFGLSWTGQVPDARAMLADMSTSTAEQHQATLADGSQVTLDAQTLLSLNFSERWRDISLDAGAAIFEVAHDPQKPFVVKAGEVRVTAIGTVFEVRHQSDGVRVTCTEGVVAVQSPGQAERRLRAGEQLTLSDSATPQFRRVDADSAMAWQHGQLRFRQRPLAELIEELNRYRPGRIILAAADKAERPVSGIFHLSRPEEALQHIVQSQGLQAAHYPGGVVLLR